MEETRDYVILSKTADISEPIIGRLKPELTNLGIT